MTPRSISKIITVSLDIQNLKNDSYFFSFPGEIEDPEAIKQSILKMYIFGQRVNINMFI